MPKAQQQPVSGHDDSAYGGQKFDVEKTKLSEDPTAPELQLNRKGLGKAITFSALACMQLLPLQLLCLGIRGYLWPHQPSLLLAMCSRRTTLCFISAFLVHVMHSLTHSCAKSCFF